LAKILKIFVSALSRVSELRFNNKWLRRFTLCMFNTDRGTLLRLTTLTILLESIGFGNMLIMAYHLTRMAHFLPY
jgi:hypothetical protein